MSKPFDYSKWDNIELSDDEEDCHPNIEKESWFRMKHRSRVEREEREEEDKKRIQAEMAKADMRIKELEHNLKRLEKSNTSADDDDDDDDDLDDREGLKAEIEELKKANVTRQAKLDEYEKNKKWNVDNMCHVAEERTMVNPDAAEKKFTETGFALPPEEKTEAKKAMPKAAASTSQPKHDSKGAAPSSVESKTTSGEATQTVALAKEQDGKGETKAGPKVEADAMLSYHEFTEKYAETVEEFMAIRDLEKCKDFLLRYGDILLQENASNYLLLASLEDEMNGYRDKMRLTARQSQIISNIAELAKSLNAHPGNVIVPFFQRMEQKVLFAGFMEGVEDFVQKIIARAVTKKIEMDRAAAGEETGGEATDLSDMPREERLGPGGLDPLEVIETLPASLQAAFESRDVDNLKKALLELEPSDAEYHMKRCVDSGLWVADANLMQSEE